MSPFLRIALLATFCCAFASTHGLEVDVATLTGEALHPPRHDHAATPMKIDGVFDEAAWQGAAELTDFKVVDPDTIGEPNYPTRVRIFYTERGLSAAYENTQPPDSVVAVLTPQVQGTKLGDFVGITIDTSGEGKYGYWMSLNASGVQTDGTLIPESQFSNDWDGAWFGKTRITDTGWNAEFFVPWSQMSMPRQQGSRRVLVFASRKVASLDERWGAPGLPFTMSKWIQHLRPVELQDVDPRQQWSAIPYASTTFDEVRNETEFRAGAEVFWRPSTNFQFSGSFFPDFGNVESDDVVVNLSAFETFFPEKRLFFLEGRDVFYTTPRSDPFRNFNPVTLVNTRRIGGAPSLPTLPDGVTLPLSERLQQAELNAAVKATGEIGGLRYGVLLASEDDTDFETSQGRVTQDGSDYSVARLSWEDNTDGVYRALGMISTLVAHPDQDAQVHGVDFHRLSATGAWKVDGQLLFSRKDDVGDGWGAFIDTAYTVRKGLTYNLKVAHFDRKLEINDLGFLNRNGVTTIEPGWRFVTSNLRRLREFSWGGSMVHEVNSENEVTRRGFGYGMDFLLNNLASIDTSVRFFGRRVDDLESFGNGSFTIPSRGEFEIDYESDQSRTLSFLVGAEVKGEKTHGLSIGGRLGLVWRPSPRMKVDALAEYIKRDAWLLHQEDTNFTTFETAEWRPRLSVDYFLTARQQFRLSAQWVAIRASEHRFYDVPGRGRKLVEVSKPAGPSDDFNLSNLNLQLRYRWEIAPLSDLFVVYTLNGIQSIADDSFGELFDRAYREPTGEQLVVKLRYRFGN